MSRFSFTACLAAGFTVCNLAAAEVAAPGPLAALAPPERNASAVPAGQTDMAAAQIVEKNVAARGGLEAWKKVQTMMWIGKILTAEGPAPAMPFMLQMERPNKTHFEINMHGDKTARIFDGVQGWRVRPSHGELNVQPYTASEINFARDAQVIDGPLIDYQTKGIAVSLDGTQEVEGRKAYRLSVTLPSGATERIFVDAQSFLEIKSEHQVRNAADLTAWVPTYYRDYQSVEGLQIPFTVETARGANGPPDKLVIQRVIVNPPIDDRAFARPDAKRGRGLAAAGGNRAHRGFQQAPPFVPGSAGAGAQDAPGASTAGAPDAPGTAVPSMAQPAAGSGAVQ